jgi:deoxycytidylate deaminase
MVNVNRLVNIAKALKPNNKNLPTFHVTFAYKKNKLLAIGMNSRKTHPRTLKYNYTDTDGKNRNHLVTVHSELSVIIKLGLEDCSCINFYVLRIDNNNKLNYSKPCSGCQDLFMQVGYRSVHYSTKSGFVKL